MSSLQDLQCHTQHCIPRETNWHPAEHLFRQVRILYHSPLSHMVTYNKKAFKVAGVPARTTCQAAPQVSSFPARLQCHTMAPLWPGSIGQVCQAQAQPKQRWLKLTLSTRSPASSDTSTAEPHRPHWVLTALGLPLPCTSPAQAECSCCPSLPGPQGWLCSMPGITTDAWMELVPGDPRAQWELVVISYNWARHTPLGSICPQAALPTAHPDRVIHHHHNITNQPEITTWLG